MFIDDKDKRKQLAKWIIGVFAACCVIFLVLNNLAAVGNGINAVIKLIYPLLLGLILAVIINVPMMALEKRLFPRAKKPALQKLRRPLALVLALAVVLVVVFGVITLVIPELVHAGSFLVDTAKKVIDMLAAADAGQENFFSRFDINWTQVRQTIDEWVKNSSGKLLSGAANIFGAAAGSVIDLVFGVIFAVYMLACKATLIRQLKRLMHVWLPRGWAEKAIHVGQIMNFSFQSFIVGQVTEAAILGSLCALGMLILGLPNVLMISILVGVCALIPIVGAYFSAVVGAFMILIVDPVKALIFLVFLIVLQQLEGNLIYPRVVGNKIKLPAIWVLAAVTVGGGLAGPFGMLIGVPLASALYALVREWTQKREAKKKLQGAEKTA